jgi:raffinose/stachyose/melibiose transport system permease protein
MKDTTRATGKKDGGCGLTAGLMLAPSVFLLVVTSIYPFCWLFRYVCFDYNGFISYFTGTYNLVRMFSDAIFWKSVLHTFEYAGLKLVFIIPLSLLLAVFLTQKIRGSGLYQAIFFLPTVISAAIYSLIFSFIFAVFNGPLNVVLSKLGLISAPVDWLGNPSVVMLSIVIVAVWGGLGNYMILFISGLSSISSETYESCRIDGANGIQTFFKITLPMLSPILKVILMLAITGAFKDYESIMVLTGGGPTNRSHVMFSYIYTLIFSSATTPQIGYATMLSVMAALIIGVITAVYLFFARKLDDVI